MTVIEFYGYKEKVLDLQNKMSTKSGIIFWLGTLFLAGFTPLPFKVFTITSGIIGFNIIAFFFICLISRGLRFYIVAFFSVKFGKTFESFIEKKGEIWFSIIGVALVAIAMIIYFIIY